jgi:hypothetical protein
MRCSAGCRGCHRRPCGHRRRRRRPPAAATAKTGACARGPAVEAPRPAAAHRGVLAGAADLDIQGANAARDRDVGGDLSPVGPLAAACRAAVGTVATGGADGRDIDELHPCGDRVALL